jgi:hypothetical protein
VFNSTVLSQGYSSGANWLPYSDGNFYIRAPIVYLDYSLRVASGGDIRAPIFYYSADTSIYFGYNSSGSYTQWRIGGSKGGYGGIYDVYSGVNGIMYDASGNGGVYNQSYGWYFYFVPGNGCMGVNGSTTSSSYGLYVTKGIYSTGDIVAYSDARKKKNIVTIDGALDLISRIRGVYYNRIDVEELNVNPNKRQIGVIAQEVNEVLPEVVTYAADVDEYGVQYGNFAGLFIEAIKEQQTIIDNQNARIADLESKLNSIVGRLSNNI